MTLESRASAANRARSIWQSQLVLAAAVVVISVVILGLDQGLFELPTFSIGVAGVVLVTALTLGLPWTGIPRSYVLAIPFADLVCVGLMSFQTDVRVSVLFAFPIIWIATHFGAAALGAALATEAVILAGVGVIGHSPAAIAGLIVVLVTTTFIGITAYATARQTRAFKLLLRMQADRLRDASGQASAGERRTTELLNAVDVGIARITMSGQLRVVNDAYARLYGLEDITQPAHSIDYDDHGGQPVPERQRPFARAARGEQFDDLRVWLFDADGEWHALSASSKRLSATDEVEAGMLLLVTDVTPIIMAQRERQQLTAMASHEMRHPLTSIVGNSELSLDFDELPPTAHDRMEAIRSSSERLLSLLSDFLSGSRSSFTQRVTGSFDLRTVLIGSVESFSVNAAAHDVQVVTQLREPLQVDGDAFRLRQVVDNVVSNAIKYTLPGGLVTVNGRREDGRVAVTITDTGIGMPAKDLARIFDPYFRADAARDVATGTGLGMGITRDLVEQQGGRLGVTSESGVGTAVTIELPVADDGLDTAPVPAGAMARPRA